MATQQLDVQTENLWQKMQLAEQNQQWKSVIDLGQQLLTLQPDHTDGKAMVARGYVQRAKGLERQGENEEAIALCNEALDLDPHYVETYIIRGKAHMSFLDHPESTGKSGLALADFDQAISECDMQLQQPEQAMMYKMRGQAYGERGFCKHGNFDLYKDFSVATQEAKADWELALADLNRVIELAPTDAEAYFLRSSLSNADQAIADLSQAITYHYQPIGDAYESRGWVLARKEQREEALRDFSQAISLGCLTAYRGRAWVYLQTEAFDKAVTDYQALFTKATAQRELSKTLSFQIGIDIKNAIDACLTAGKSHLALPMAQRFLTLYSRERQLLQTEGFTWIVNGLLGILKHRMESDNFTRLQYDGKNNVLFQTWQKVLDQFGDELNPVMQKMFIDWSNELGRVAHLTIYAYTQKNNPYRALQAGQVCLLFLQSHKGLLQGSGLIEIFSKLSDLLSHEIYAGNIDRFLVFSRDDLIQTLKEMLSKSDGTFRKTMEEELNSIWSFHRINSDDDFDIKLASVMLQFFPKRALMERARLYRYKKYDYKDMTWLGKATKDYQQALKIDPHDPVLYQEYAACYHLLEDYEMAVAYYTSALDLTKDDESNAKIYGERADVLKAMKNYQQAVDDYTVAMRLDPGNTSRKSWLSGRAFCYQRLQNYQRAKADYETLLRSETNSESQKYYQDRIFEIEMKLRE